MILTLRPKLKKKFCLLLFVAIVFNVNAQQPCGNESITPQESLMLLQELQTMNRADVSPTGLVTIPFKPHIVRTDAGTGGADAATVMANIEAARDKYLPYGITIDILPINYIDNTDLMVLGTNGDPGSGYAEGDSTLQLNNVPNVVNAYFVTTAYGASGGGIGGYARFPWNLPNDYFVVVNNSPFENGATVAHEMGHYFGLLHTFETANGEELVDGSNCSTAGDLLCDTPADGFNTYGDVNGGSCDYTSGTDANGDFYAADETQIMSYNQPFSCVDNFSPEAEARIRYYMGKETPGNTRAYLFQPNVSCNTYSASLDSGGNVSISSDDIDDGSTDPNGDAITFSLSQSTFSCSDLGEKQVILTATDPNGFSSSCTTTVTISDNIPFTAVCQTQTISLDNSGVATMTTALIDDGSTIGGCGLSSEYLTKGFADTSLNIADAPNVYGPGYMFSVTGVNPITINSFDIKAYNTALVSGVAEYEVYYKSGSWSGSQFNSSHWTLVGSATLSVADFDVVPLNLSLGIALDQGETASFYITTTDDSRILYETGNTIGSLWINDSNIEVYEGVYSAYPFAGVASNPYMFNGNIIYNAAVPFDGDFDCTDVGSHTVTLNRKDSAGNIQTCDAIVYVTDTSDPSISCLSNFSVESEGDYSLPDYYGLGSITASDNCTLSSVTQTPIAGTMLSDGVHEISFLATDDNGNTSTCSFNLTVNDNTLSVDYFNNLEKNILVYPNPTENNIFLKNNSNVSLKSLRLLDINGRLLLTLDKHPVNDVIDLSNYANGIYMLQIQTEKGMVIKKIIKE
ncbi:T9SS type A sorting domain-containing protein [Corallibacter sp.]|uniref:T9SS type A sorting domain-containing protein n=1 Tax=Corallibacter sp. TaxID=2038084 RepID=UPI003A8D7940